MDREDLEKRDAELGYRSAGARELGLRDWMSLREDEAAYAPTPKAFDVLVNRLRARKWAKDNPERATARSRRWQLAHPDQHRAAQNRRRWRRWVVTAGLGITCAGCGVAFCEAYPRRGLSRRYCTPRCKWRHDGREHYKRTRGQR